jgi:ATP synthase protein I
VVIAVVLIAGALGGTAAAVSAFLGGGIGVLGSVVFLMLTAVQQPSAEGVVRVLIRAEAVKIAVIVLLLWLCFATYRELVVVAFFGAFVVSVLVSGIVNAVPDD